MPGDHQSAPVDAFSAPSCHVCGSASVRFLPYRGIVSDLTLEVEAFADRYVWRCSACSHVFCDPMPDGDLLARYYRLFYWENMAPVRSRAVRLRESRIGDWLSFLRATLPGSQNRFRSQFRLLQRHLKLGGVRSVFSVSRTLEIGAGPALFSRYLRMRFGRRVQCDVVEPGTRFAAAYDRNHVRKVASHFQDMREDKSYRAIHASHWLEHMADVDDVFRKFRSLLAPNGVAFIEVPNCEEPYWQYRYFPDPPHLQFFTPTSLRKLVEGHGFRVLQIETEGMPLDLEREVGFLEPDTPMVIPSAEQTRLNARRRARSLAVEKRLARDAKMGSTAQHGRVFLRIVFAHASG